MSNKFSKVIFITGTDGAGKSCLADFLNRQMKEKGVRSFVVWSRFHNYLSKPLLALSRLSGHNYYNQYDGIRLGFHDFENIPLFGWLFILLQVVDVNISAFLNVTRLKPKYDVMICERGPWDTFSDVMADTGIRLNPLTCIGRLFLLQASDGLVFYVRRSMENVLSTRPELVYDHKLHSKIDIYDDLAATRNWHVIDNNRTLHEAELDLISRITWVS
jgi:hypothetical protein